MLTWHQRRFALLFRMLTLPELHTHQNKDACLCWHGISSTSSCRERHAWPESNGCRLTTLGCITRNLIRKPAHLPCVRSVDTIHAVMPEAEPIIAAAGRQKDTLDMITHAPHSRQHSACMLAAASAGLESCNRVPGCGQGLTCGAQQGRQGIGQQSGQGPCKICRPAGASGVQIPTHR